MRTDSRELLAVGIFGRSSLFDRIEMLLKHGREFSPRPSLARVAASAVVLTLFAIAGSLAPRWIAFAQEPDRPSFAVASIRPSKGGERSMRANPQGIHYTAVTVMQCIAEAYQVRYNQITGQQLTDERYDLEAKAADTVTKEQSRLMLQTLLASRFKLVLHHDSKIMPVYKLVAGKDGPKLHESQTEGEGRMARGQDGFEFRSVSMQLFSAILSGRLGRPVLDQTGIKGPFDFTLNLDLDSEDPSSPESKIASADWSSSSIFTNIQKQLGLRLDADRAPVDFLVIDHVEKPSEN